MVPPPRGAECLRRCSLSWRRADGSGDNEEGMVELRRSVDESIEVVRGVDQGHRRCLRQACSSIAARTLR